MLCRQDPVSGRLSATLPPICARAAPCTLPAAGSRTRFAPFGPTFNFHPTLTRHLLQYKNTAGPGLYVYLTRFENTYTRHRTIPVLDGNGQRDGCGPRGVEEEDGARSRRQLERGCQTSLRGNHTEKTDARSRRIHRQASRVLKDPRLERSSRDPKMAGP